VVHRASGAASWAMAKLPPPQPKLPVSEERKNVPLKSRSQWRYIGKESNSLFDLPEMVTGKSYLRHGRDHAPAMVYASV